MPCRLDKKPCLFFLVLGKLDDIPACRDDSRKRDVRTGNIAAAKAVADAVRTSLGPRGMDKMVQLWQFIAANSKIALSELLSHWAIWSPGVSTRGRGDHYK